MEERRNVIKFVLSYDAGMIVIVDEENKRNPQMGIIIDIESDSTRFDPNTGEVYAKVYYKVLTEDDKIRCYSYDEIVYAFENSEISNPINTLVNKYDKLKENKMWNMSGGGHIKW